MKYGSSDFPDEDVPETVTEYISFLHDRIEFLEDELRDSQQELLLERESGGGQVREQLLGIERLISDLMVKLEDVGDPEEYKEIVEEDAPFLNRDFGDDDQEWHI